MRLDQNPILPTNAQTPYEQDLNFRLARMLRNIANQVNALSEGIGAAYYQAAPAAPTTGTHNQGDFVTNSNITEVGTAGSKYTVAGFRCVVGGTPGTWVPVRNLTGN